MNTIVVLIQIYMIILLDRENNNYPTILKFDLVSIKE